MNRRNATIAAGAVTGVILAGTAAIAANTSILNAADDNNVGELSAAAVVNASPADAEPQVIEVYIDEPAPASAATSAPTSPPASVEQVAAEDESPTQAFTVDVAGTVEVTEGEEGIVLAAVLTNEGWSWQLTSVSEASLVVTFTSGDTEFVFFADVGDDGSITARVEQPIVRIVQAPAASVATGGAAPASDNAQYDGEREADHDDDDERDDYDESDDEDDDHDERDDEDEDDHDERDDEDEREGGDDDD